MAVVVGALVVGLVLLIAALAVAREAARLRAEPPPALFDVEDAVDWVVQHVPDDVAATLTLEDVRRIVDLQLEFFQKKGVSRNGQDSEPSPTVVVGGSETVEYILGRAKEDGEEYTILQVHAVVETQLAYLRSIGAVGSPADDAELGDVDGSGLES